MAGIHSLSRLPVPYRRRQLPLWICGKICGEAGCQNETLQRGALSVPQGDSPRDGSMSAHWLYEPSMFCEWGVRVGGAHISCKQHSDIGEGGLCCTAIIRCCDSKSAETTSKQ